MEPLLRILIIRCWTKWRRSSRTSGAPSRDATPAVSTSAAGPASAGLPQVVRQDAGRSQERPQDLGTGPTRRGRHPINDLGNSAERHLWERANPGDPDVKPPDHRVLLLINERIQ